MLVLPILRLVELLAGLYLHCLRSQKGVFLFPDENKSELTTIGNLRGFGGEISTCSLKIPGIKDSYKDYEEEIKKEESTFINKLLNTYSFDDHLPNPV